MRKVNGKQKMAVQGDKVVPEAVTAGRELHNPASPQVPRNFYLE